jgi:hypothetical protein
MAVCSKRDNDSAESLPPSNFLDQQKQRGNLCYWTSSLIFTSVVFATYTYRNAHPSS